MHQPDAEILIQALERIQGGAILLSSDWRVLYVSANALTLLGISLPEEDQPLIWDCSCFKDITTWRAAFEEAFHKRIPTLELPFKNGEWIRWHLHSSDSGYTLLPELLPTFSHTNAGRDAHLVDMQRHENLLEEVQSIAHVGFWEYDIKSDKLFWSDFIHTLLGTDPKQVELTYDLFFGFVHPADRQMVHQAYQEHLSSRKPYNIIHRIVSGKGQIKTVREYCYTEMDSAGTPIRSIGVMMDLTGTTALEDQVLQSEREFKELFDRLPVGIVYQERNGQITRANEAASTLLGLTWGQMVGRQSMHPAWRAMRQDGSPFPGEEHPAMEALRTGKPVREVIMGIYHPEKDANVWILVNADPEFKEGELEPYRVFTSFIDISERMETLQLLQESESVLNSILNSSKESIFAVDNNQQVLFFNRTFANDFQAVYNVTVEKGHRLIEILPDPVYQQWMSRLNQVKEGQTIHAVDHVVAGNHEFFIEVSIVPLQQQDQINGAVIFSRDLTNEELARKALLESNERFQSIFNNSASPMLLVDVGMQTIIDANLAAENFYGWNKQELLAKKVSEFNVQPLDALQNLEKLKFESQNQILQVTHKRADGSIRDVEIYASLIKQGKEEMVMEIIIDVTDRNRYIHATEIKNKILQDIAWSQSHLVRAPLSRMMGLISLINTDSILTGSLSEDQLRIILDNIVKSGKELDFIIKDITDKTALVSNIEHEGIYLHRDSMPLDDFEEMQLLMVDDDPLMLMLQEQLCIQAGLHPKPVPFNDANVALSYIEKEDRPGLVFLVLLDIHMQPLNGWDFMEKINKLTLQGQLKIVIVTGTDSMYERIYGSKFAYVIDHITKPVTVDMLRQLKNNNKISVLWRIDQDTQVL